MLASNDTSGDGADQGLRAKVCPCCGSSVFGRTLHTQYCEACKTSRKRAKDIVSAERRRRKAGVAKVKGETFCCQLCGSDFVATSKSRALYCEPCRPDAGRARSRERSKSRSGDPHRKERFNAWYRDQRRRPEIAVSRHMSTMISRGLATGKSGKSWRDLVDYSLEELVRHIERQFLPGMSWENRSEWHIDHIVPKSSFEFSTADCEGFKAAWALTNLRPIWASDNVRKQAKQIYLI